MPLAEARFREALALRRARGAGPGEIAATLEQLGATLSDTGKHAEAEPYLREALALRRQSGPDTPETMATIDLLGLTLHRKGDFKEAEALFRDAVEQGRRLPAAVTPARVSTALNLALLVHRYDRDARAAEPMYREALSLARRLYPNDHADVATCMSEFARGLRDLGKLSEAEALSREALAMFRRLYGDRHRETMISAQSLAGMLAEQEKLKEAESLYREALATGRVALRRDASAGGERERRVRVVSRDARTVQGSPAAARERARGRDRALRREPQRDREGPDGARPECARERSGRGGRATPAPRARGPAEAAPGRALADRGSERRARPVPAARAPVRGSRAACSARDTKACARARTRRRRRSAPR